MSAAVAKAAEGVLGPALEGPALGVTGVKGRCKGVFKGVMRVANGVVPRPLAVGALNGFGAGPLLDVGFAAELSGAFMGLLRQHVARENLVSA